MIDVFFKNCNNSWKILLGIYCLNSVYQDDLIYLTSINCKPWSHDIESSKESIALIIQLLFLSIHVSWFLFLNICINFRNQGDYKVKKDYQKDELVHVPHKINLVDDELWCETLIFPIRWNPFFNCWWNDITNSIFESYCNISKNLFSSFVWHSNSSCRSIILITSEYKILESKEEGVNKIYSHKWDHFKHRLEKHFR